MGIFKEEAHIFNVVAKKQRQIYNDACDYGYPYLKEIPPTDILQLFASIKTFADLDKQFPEEKKFIRKREQYFEGVQITIRIGWAIENGMEVGSEYIIAYTYLGKRYSNLPNAMVKEQLINCFVSVDCNRYSEPK